MPVNRPSRGVPLPTFGQWLLVLVLGGAGYFLWTVNSQQSRNNAETATDRLLQDLQAVDAMVDRGSEALPELIAQAASDDPRRRRMAMLGLGRLRDEAAGALETVRSGLTDKDQSVRSEALWAFTQICADSDDLWQTIARLLDDPERAIRTSAASLLRGATTHHITLFARRPLGKKYIVDLTPEENATLIRVVLALAHSDRAETRGLVIQVVTARDFQRDDLEVNDVLQGLLSDSDAEVRAAAIAAVAQRGTARADDVRVWLRDADPKVVDSALSAVPWLGPDGEQVVPELLALVDKVADERLPALIGALRLDKANARPALPGLVRRVAALDPTRIGSLPAQESARRLPQYLSLVGALLEIEPDPDELLPILKRILVKYHAEYSQQVAAMLAKVDPDEARRLTTQMIRDIESDPIRDRDSVALKLLGALGGLGPNARDAVPLLTRLIEQDNDKQPWIAFWSIVALGGIGPDAAPAIPCLLASLKRPKTDDNSWVRDEVVIKSLGKIGPAARSAVPAILEVLGQAPPPKTEGRRSTSDTATETGPPLFFYEAAIVALGKIGDDSDQVLSRLRQEFSKDDGWQSRLIAMQSLILLCRHADHSEILLPDLIRALEDENDDVRLVAACLGQIQGDRTPAISSLIKALDDDDPWVVSAAALSLREIGPAAESAAPRLRELTEKGRNRSANAIRVQRRLELRLLEGEQLVVLRFPTGAFDLGHLSVSQAARLALEVIESTSDNAPRVDPDQPESSPAEP